MEFENALDEYMWITSHYSGNTQKTSYGYEFFFWADSEDEMPSPQHPGIEWKITFDVLDGEDCLKFEMTLPYEVVKA